MECWYYNWSYKFQIIIKMIKQYFTQFLRNVKRDKKSFFINIIGLSTALTCALLIYLWVMDEISKDKFHQNDKKLYQIMYNLPPSNQGVVTWKLTPVMMADRLAVDFPEIEMAVGVNNIKILGNKEGIPGC